MSFFSILYNRLILFKDQTDSGNRSNDGLTLLMTSSDGFCSTLAFEPGELGTHYTGPLAGASAAYTTASTLSTGPFTATAATGLGLGLERSGSSTQNTPVQTPTSAANAGSASPFPGYGHSHSASNSWNNSGMGHQRTSSNASVTSTSLSNVTGAGGFSTPAPTPAVAANSPTPTPSQSQTPHIYQPTPIPSSYTNAGFVATTPGMAGSFSSYGRPSSPTRSNSASSIATQASNMTGVTGFGLSNTMRESRDRDSTSASGVSNPTLMGGTVPSVGYGVGVGATPPQTPRSTASSVVGVGAKRDVSVSEVGGEAEGVSGGEGAIGGRVEGGEKKRRRIAPTLVSGGDSNTSSSNPK